jgi:hypothetical protein
MKKLTYLSARFNKKLFSTLLALFMLGAPLMAQNEVEMADTLRSEGKIYVVVAILLLILLGLLAYVFAMDRKVSALEKKLNNKS